MFDSLSFRTKMSGLVVVTAIATGSFVSLVSYSHMTATAFEAGREQLHAEAMLNAELIRAPFEAMKQDTDVLSANPSLVRLIDLSLFPPSDR